MATTSRAEEENLFQEASQMDVDAEERVELFATPLVSPSVTPIVVRNVVVRKATLSAKAEIMLKKNVEELLVPKSMQAALGDELDDHGKGAVSVAGGEDMSILPHATPAQPVGGEDTSTVNSPLSDSTGSVSADSSITPVPVLVVGSRVKVFNRGHGVVLFVGEDPVAKTTVREHDVWYGVILDNAKGTNDGSSDGIRFFCCPENHGVLVQRDQLKEVSMDADELTLKMILGGGIVTENKLARLSIFKLAIFICSKDWNAVSTSDMRKADYVAMALKFMVPALPDSQILAPYVSQHLPEHTPLPEDSAHESTLAPEEGAQIVDQLVVADAFSINSVESAQAGVLNQLSAPNAEVSQRTAASVNADGRVDMSLEMLSQPLEPNRAGALLGLKNVMIKAEAGIRGNMGMAEVYRMALDEIGALLATVDPVHVGQKGMNGATFINNMALGAASSVGLAPFGVYGITKPNVGGKAVRWADSVDMPSASASDASAANAPVGCPGAKSVLNAVDAGMWIEGTVTVGSGNLARGGDGGENSKCGEISAALSGEKFMFLRKDWYRDLKKGDRVKFHVQEHTCPETKLKSKQAVRMHLLGPLALKGQAPAAEATTTYAQVLQAFLPAASEPAFNAVAGPKAGASTLVKGVVSKITDDNFGVITGVEGGAKEFIFYRKGSSRYYGLQLDDQVTFRAVKEVSCQRAVGISKTSLDLRSKITLPTKDLRGKIKPLKNSVQLPTSATASLEMASRMEPAETSNVELKVMLGKLMELLALRADLVVTGPLTPAPSSQ